MPRALAIRYLTPPPAARAAYLARLAERVASAKAAGFHLWAFEDDARPGRFVEFVETRDAAALRTALLHDELLGEALDFRHPPDDPGAASGVPAGDAPLAPGGAPAGAWARFTGVADR
jgi:hypothetical protein